MIDRRVDSLLEADRGVNRVHGVAGFQLGVARALLSIRDSRKRRYGVMSGEEVIHFCAVFDQNGIVFGRKGILGLVRETKGLIDSLRLLFGYLGRKLNLWLWFIILRLSMTPRVLLAQDLHWLASDEHRLLLACDVRILDIVQPFLRFLVDVPPQRLRNQLEFLVLHHLLAGLLVLVGFLHVGPQEVGAYWKHFFGLLVQVVLEVDILLGAGCTEQDLLDVGSDLQKLAVLAESVGFEADLRIDWPGLEGVLDRVSPHGQVVACKHGVAQVG